MRLKGRSAIAVIVCALLWVVVRPVSGQQRSVDWRLHSFDLSSTRYVPLDEINASNVGELTLTWSAQPGGNFGAQTPVVVDGVLYVNSGSSLFALNGETGEVVWTFEAEPAFRGGGRGPAYGDGRVYAFGASVVYAVDARTGQPIESFGDGGLLRIVNKALEFKYPGKYPPDVDPTTLGYSMTTPPTYWNGTLYVGIPFSDSLVEGGLLIAVDGRTGAVKWVFNTIPQGPQDDGWEIAKDTWSISRRYGGGIWAQPAIDPALGLIYVNIGNPSPNYDGSARLGGNLFTNSIAALDLNTGTLVWHFQVLHHDIWDWDLSSGPLLFDVAAGGTTINGVAAFGKNCFAYFLDRETGEPINPIVETPVPTTTDVPGEQVWPTQPVPYTAQGIPQQPFCAIYPSVKDPALVPLVRPSLYPYQVGEFVITSPGNLGGANYGAPSFSPRTSLVYVTGKNDAFSFNVAPVGDTLRPGRGNMGHFSVIAERGETGMTASGTLTAYDPVTGQRVWQAEMPGTTNSGNLVTAGDLVFQGVGTEFYAFEARTGKQLFRFAAENASRASPLSYQVNGKQYVAIVASGTVLAFALPESRS